MALPTFVDRNVEFPGRFVVTKAGGGALSSGDTLSFTESPGTITEAGTAINASVMNQVATDITDTVIDVKNLAKIMSLGGLPYI